MKIAILSDLHREFDDWEPDVEPLLATDVIVLAGDIEVGARGIRWAQRAFAGKPVIYVAGNHEFYTGHWTTTLTSMRAAAAGSNVHFFEDDQVVIDGVRFLGATLWTNFRLLGKALAFRAMVEAKRTLSDHRKIAIDGVGLVAGGKVSSVAVYRRLTPMDPRSRFKTSFMFLKRSLATPFDGPTIVGTHHLPLPRSIAPQYQGSLVNPAFVSDLSVLIDRFQPALWIHGHTHCSADYRHGVTRVVCNPRGYPNVHQEPENAGFDLALSVEL